VKTLDIDDALKLPPGQLLDWAYNAVDCTVTREIHDNLQPLLDRDPEAKRTYAFERAVQAPAFAMTERGILVDGVMRQQEAIATKREFNRLVKAIAKDPEIVAVWDGAEKETGVCLLSTRKDHRHTWEKWEKGKSEVGRVCSSCGAPRLKIKPFSVTSSRQRVHLFYTLWKMKVQTGKTGEVTADKEAMGRLKNQYPKRAALIDKMLETANLQKQLTVLEARLTKDGRYPTGFRVGNAWTGRWSSTKNHYGEGGNAQNIAERHRHVFVSDPGYLLDYGDLMQAESNVVAHLAGDEEYIAAHKSGDVHTYVTRLVWPEGCGGKPWTGDLALDKPIAKQLPEWDPAPGHDFRFQSKRIQHGSNFGLTPIGISYIAHIPQAAAFAAQAGYFRAFPGIPGWQRSVAQKVQNGERLVNPLGRPIRLFGRPWDKHTIRQGLAFLPQSTVADIINVAVWRVWQELEPKEAQLLAQVHDALLLQFLKDRPEIARRVMELMIVPVPVVDYKGVTRMATVLTEAAVGENWGHFNKDTNPHGIKEI
jgi:DNA polymerase I-like protein with 3'-5' exonuclease and polymerase domains